MKKVSVLALAVAVSMLAVSCKNQPKEEAVVEEVAVEEVAPVEEVVEEAAAAVEEAAETVEAAAEEIAK